MLDRSVDHKAAEPGGQEREPARGTPAPRGARAILALQRTAGNAAVASLLAKRPVVARDTTAGVDVPPRIEVPPPRIGDDVEMDRAIYLHFANEDWPSAARILTQFSQDKIDERMRRYRREWRNGLITAANVDGADADRIWQPAHLENTIEWAQWDLVARALDGYGDPARIGRRAQTFAPGELAHALSHAQRQGLGVAVAIAGVAAARSGEIATHAGQAIVSGDFDAAAVALNALSDAGIEAQLAGRTPPQLYDLWLGATREVVPRIAGVLGAEPRAGLIRTEGLDRKLREDAAGEDWDAATATLLRFNDDAERRAGLASLPLTEIKPLAWHLRGRGRAAPVPVLMLRAVVETVLAATREREYAAAVGAGSWIMVVLVLDAYDDDELLAKGHDLKRRGGTELLDQLHGLANRYAGRDLHVARLFSFLAVEDKTGAAIHTPATSGISPGAADGPAVAVDGGTVTTYTHARFGSQTDWFGEDYQGADAQNTGWLQFVTREAEMFGASGTSLGFETSVETTATGQEESRHWSTPEEPSWTLDTFGDTAPFTDAASTQEHRGTPAGARPPTDASAGQMAVYDRPGPVLKVAQAAFDEDPDGGKVDHVVLRLRFHRYLVRRMAVLYENTITVEFNVSGKHDDHPGQHNLPGAGKAASRLHRAHYDALIRRFPEWTIYPHD